MNYGGYVGDWSQTYHTHAECGSFEETDQTKEKEFCSEKAGSNKAKSGETIERWIHRGNTIPGMVSEPSNGQRGKWKVEDVCRFHRSQQRMP